MAALMRRCAVDIGGTLAKVAVISPESAPAVTADLEAGGTISGLNCALLQRTWNEQVGPFRCDVYHFKTHSQMAELISFVKKCVPGRGEWLPLTGGGAYKYQARLERELAVAVEKHDELRCAMRGLTLLLSRYDAEVYRFDAATKAYTPVTRAEEVAFPLGVVNVGSGVSVLKASSPTDFERVSGTCVGGGTVMGLARLLVQAQSFQEVCDLAAAGSNALDLTVRDLLGDSAGSSSLPADALASSFGRPYATSLAGPLPRSTASSRPPAADRPSSDVVREEAPNFPSHAEPNADAAEAAECAVTRENVARSLVTMVSYNLGYLAYLLGRLHGVSRFIFTGKYINHQIVTLEDVVYALDFYYRYYGCRVARPLSRGADAAAAGGGAAGAGDAAAGAGDAAAGAGDGAAGAGDGAAGAGGAGEAGSGCFSGCGAAASGAAGFGAAGFSTAPDDAARMRTSSLAVPGPADKSGGFDLPRFSVFSMRHDGYLGAVGALLLSLELHLPQPEGHVAAQPAGQPQAQPTVAASQPPPQLTVQPPTQPTIASAVLPLPPPPAVAAACGLAATPGPGVAQTS